MSEEEKDDKGPESKKPEPKPKKKEPKKELILEDGTAIAIPSGPESGLYLIQDGKRRWIPDTWTSLWLGVRMDYVVVVFPEQGESIPLGAPVPSHAPEEPLF